VAQVSESFLPDDLCTETPPTELSEDATKKLQQMLRSAEGLLLLVLHPEGGVGFLHSVAVTGGTPMQPDVAMGALLGVDELAPAVSLAQVGILRSKLVPAPTADAILGVSAESGLAGLVGDSAATRTSSPMTSFKAAVLLPPSLVDCVLGARSSAWNLITAIKRRLDEEGDASAEADAGSGDDGQASELRSNAAVRRVLQWLWFIATATAADAPSISLCPTTDPTLTKYARDMHARHITGFSRGSPSAGAARGPDGPTEAAVAGAAAAMTRAATEVSALTGAVSAIAEKAGRKNAMNSTIKQGVAAFCRTEGEWDVPLSNSVLPAGLLEVLEHPNLTQAAVSLQLAISAASGVQTDLQGLTTYIRIHGFGLNDSDIYSGFTCFAFAPTGAVDNSSLYLAASQKQGYSTTQTKKLMKQHYQCPKGYDSAKRQLSAFVAGLESLSGEESEPSIFARRVLRHVRHNEHQYRRLSDALRDKFWLGLFANIDSSIHAYWNVCLRSPSTANDNLDMFKLEEEFRRLQKAQNPFTPPPGLRLVSTPDGKSDSDSSDSEKGKSKKKRRTKDNARGDGRRSKNKHCIFDEFPTEQFRQRFGSAASKYGDRTDINGCKFCPPFHLLGHCGAGSQCKFVASHINRSLRSKEKEDLRGYVEACKRDFERAEE